MKKRAIAIIAVAVVMLWAAIVLGAALTADRNTPARSGDSVSMTLAAGQKAYAGGLAAWGTGGNAYTGTTWGTTTAAKYGGVGRFAAQVDATSAAKTVPIDRGIFRFGNSASTDQIKNSDIGTTCYIVDDQTVAKTSGDGNRSAAGKVWFVDSDGVWVDMR